MSHGSGFVNAHLTYDELQESRKNSSQTAFWQRLIQDFWKGARSDV